MLMHAALLRSLMQIDFCPLRVGCCFRSLLSPDSLNDLYTRLESGGKGERFASPAAFRRSAGSIQVAGAGCRFELVGVCECIMNHYVAELGVYAPALVAHFEHGPLRV